MSLKLQTLRFHGGVWDGYEKRVTLAQLKASRGYWRVPVKVRRVVEAGAKPLTRHSFYVHVYEWDGKRFVFKYYEELV